MLWILNQVELEVAGKFKENIESASHELILEYLLFPWRGNSSCNLLMNIA